MKKIFVMLAALVVVMMLNAAPANAAGTGAVNSNEFWSNLSGMTQGGFQSWANVTPTGSGFVSGSGGTEKWVDYDALNSSFTRDVVSVSIHYKLFGDGSWGITNPPNKPYGGKWENTHVSQGEFTYGVQCTTASC